MSSLSQMVCSGCDETLPPHEFLTFACPNAGSGTDDTDHVLRVRMDPVDLAEAWPKESWRAEDNPFLRYRRLSHSYHLALRSGLSDSQYVETVAALTKAIEAVDGSSLRLTPLLHSEALDLSVKNETVNISGSHKGRHLIGTALHLELAKRCGQGGDGSQTLAIASCGNAALAAAVVARAADRKLGVFVPPWADKAVTQRLRDLGAEMVVCERRESDPPGDPCYLRFREAVEAGALPFSCQGSDNALALLGGHNLGWELIDQSQGFDHVFVQVGGGALASSLMQAYLMAIEAGIIDSLPRFHAVQTDNAHPLARAWQKLQQGSIPLDQARHHRSEYMWPWETAPESIASGILDDETYDWFSIASGLAKSGGSVVTVSEDRIAEAHRLGQEKTGIAVCVTGTSGLAGCLEMRSQGKIAKGESCALLFTGAFR